MKLSALRLLAATATLRAAAFAPSPRSSPHRSPLRLSSAGDGVLAHKKVLTAADVEAKASTRAADPAAPNAEDAPRVFPPEIYDGFQAALLLLEQRAKEGPGSLSAAEVGALERETGRIVREMRAYERDPKRVAGMIAQMYEKEGAEEEEEEEEAATPAAPSAPPAVAPAAARAPPPPAARVAAPPAAAAVARPASPPPPPAAEAPTPFTAAEVAAVAAAAADGGARDVGEEEYHDDSINHGLAKGTTNTFAIPGMHEMGAEEYRAKLQETISGRQRERRRLAHESGIIGNRSSNGYLDTLSAGGSGGMWKKTAAAWKKKEEEEEETQGEPSATVVEGRGAAEREQGREREEVAGAAPGARGHTDRDEARGSAVEQAGTKAERVGAIAKDEEDDDSKRPDDQATKQARTKAPEQADAIADDEGDDDSKRPDDPAMEQVKIEALEQVGTIAEDEGDDDSQRLEEQRCASAARREARQRAEKVQTELLQMERANREEQATEDINVKESAAGKDAEAGTARERPSPPLSPLAAMRQQKFAEELTRAAEWTPKEPPETTVRQNELVRGWIREIRDAPTSSSAAPEDAAAAPPPPNAFPAPPQEAPAPPQAVLSRDSSGQRPVPSLERKASFFSVHVPQGGEDRTAAAEKVVSGKPTAAFVHGDEENSQRPARPLRSRGPRTTTASPDAGGGEEYFQVHSSPIVKPTRAGASSARRPAPQKRATFVEDAQRQRPVPTTARPEHAERTDHRSAGDARKGARRRPATAASLVGTERRARPAASSAASYPAAAVRSLAESEGRVRPVSSSAAPAHARVEDRRSVGDSHSLTRQKLESSSGPGGTSRGEASLLKSLIEKEARVRPVPSAARPAHADFRADHRGPGDSHSLSQQRLDASSSGGALASLIQKEERVRPVASTARPHHADFSPNHRGPGDAHSLTQQRLESSLPPPATDSLSKTERSVRPTAPSSALAATGRGETLEPTSHQSQSAPVTSDHRDPGDAHSLTKQRSESFLQRVAAASLSEAEQRVRPVPAARQPRDESGPAPSSSHQSRRGPVTSDHRGPGDDTHTLTQKRSDSTSPASLSETERRMRPTPASFHRLQNARAVSDHRGPGDDTHTLTRKRRDSAARATQASLSETERRARPAPSSSRDGSRNVRIAADHRGPGDASTLTRKVQAIPAPSSDVFSLAEDERRQRPVPPSSGGDRDDRIAAFVNDRTGDTYTRTRPPPATSPSTVTSQDEHWWAGKTVRRTAGGPSGDKDKVTDKVTDQRATEPSSTSAEKEPSSHAPPRPPSAMQSLLKEERHGAPVGANATAAKPPIASLPPSSLQSLLKRGSLSPLSALLRDEPRRAPTQHGARPSPAYELEWWNEKPARPRGYVRHFQPIRTSYEKKFEPPKDYGNIVTADVDPAVQDGPGEGALGEEYEESSDDDADGAAATIAQEEDEEDAK